MNKKVFIGFTAMLLILGVIFTSTFIYMRTNQTSIANRVASLVFDIGGDEAKVDINTESQDSNSIALVIE